MPLFQGTELEDGRYLGLSVREVTALPHVDVFGTDAGRMGEIFEGLLGDLSRLCGESAALELLWLSQPVSGQKFPARARLFLLLRKLSATAAQTEREMDAFLSAMEAVLTQKGCSLSGGEALTGLLEQAEGQLHALVRQEKVPMSFFAQFPYYHYDTLQGCAVDFASLLTALCGAPGGALSVQVIPAALSPEEQFAAEQMRQMLSQAVSGMPGQIPAMGDDTARRPLETYTYYAQDSGPRYLMNLLVGGQPAACAALLARVQSALRGVSLTDMDLTGAFSLGRDLLFSPWNISTALIYQYRDGALWQNLQGMEALMRLPYLYTEGETAKLLQIPVDDGSLPGIVSNRVDLSGALFDKAVLAEDNIVFGHLAGDERVRIGAPLKAFTRHGLIVGTPGTGKTTFSVDMLLQFYEKGIPFLAIEPTKTEYRAMIDAIPDLQIFTPGNSGVSPFLCNPFLPPRNITVEKYIPSLVSAFQAAFSMPSPLDMIFLSAVRAAYTKYGWKNSGRAGDPDVQPFGLYEFILCFKELVANSGYSGEVRSNLQSGGTLRLMNLLEQNASIYDTIHTIPLDDLLSKPTVLELNAIENQEQKALLMALLLISVCTHTKQNQKGDGELTNIILIDEAHVLLGGKSRADGAGGQDTTVRALQNMIAEIRSYGTGILIADQSPTAVSRPIVANTDIKVSFRLVQGEEKAALADSTGMEETQRQHLGRLGVGEAFVYYSRLDAPQLVKTTDSRAAKGIRLSVPDGEIADRMTYWTNHGDLLKPCRECGLCPQCAGGCDLALRDRADYYAARVLQENGVKMKDRSNAAQYAILLHKPLALWEGTPGADFERLCFCTRLRLLRKIALEKGFVFTPREMETILLPREKGE